MELNESWTFKKHHKILKSLPKRLEARIWQFWESWADLPVLLSKFYQLLFETHGLWVLLHEKRRMKPEEPGGSRGSNLICSALLKQLHKVLNTNDKRQRNKAEKFQLNIKDLKHDIHLKNKENLTSRGSSVQVGDATHRKRTIPSASTLSLAPQKQLVSWPERESGGVPLEEQRGCSGRWQHTWISSGTGCEFHLTGVCPPLVNAD